MSKIRSISRSTNKKYSKSMNTSPYSINHHKGRDKKISNKIQPDVSDWTHILQDIEVITGKVKNLCIKQNQSISCKTRTKSKIHSKSIIPKSLQNNLILTQLQEQPKQIITYPACNPTCHDLMHECMKLNRENEKLVKQKQALQKRLYYESKERRQLRWKLQKQKQKQKQTYNQQIYSDYKNMDSNCFTLRVSNQKFANREISQTSYLTAKKSSPLRDRTIKFINLSKNMQKSNKQNRLHSKEQNNSDSLLIDLSIDSRKITEEPIKTTKSITLERDLNELLEMCKNETDKNKKKILRKKMQVVAEQLRDLKNQ